MSAARSSKAAVKAANASSNTLRRRPLPDILRTLRTGEGAVALSPAVSAVSVRFVDHNNEPGPRDFLKAIAAQLAYHNPALPFHIHRIPDARTKSKDPETRDRKLVAQVEESGEAAKQSAPEEKPTMTVDFFEHPSETVPLSHLSSSQILQQLIAVAGEERFKQVESPAAERL